MKRNYIFPALAWGMAEFTVNRVRATSREAVD